MKSLGICEKQPAFQAVNFMKRLSVALVNHRYVKAARIRFAAVTNKRLNSSDMTVKRP